MIHCENKYSLLLGDFNLDLLKFELHPSTEMILNTLGTFCFQPHVLQPTRIIDQSATLIDNIFFNSLEHFFSSGNLCYDLSDHLSYFLIVSRQPFIPANIKVFRRDKSNFDRQALITDIQSINWDDSLRAGFQPSNVFDSFYNEISEVVDIHIPIKQLSKQELKDRSKPWITSGTRTSIKIKSGLIQKFLKAKPTYYHAKI